MLPQTGTTDKRPRCGRLPSPGGKQPDNRLGPSLVPARQPHVARAVPSPPEIPTTASRRAIRPRVDLRGRRLSDGARSRPTPESALGHPRRAHPIGSTIALIENATLCPLAPRVDLPCGHRSACPFREQQKAPLILGMVVLQGPTRDHPILTPCAAHPRARRLQSLNASALGPAVQAVHRNWRAPPPFP
jgi:hypothetical protein